MANTLWWLRFVAIFHFLLSLSSSFSGAFLLPSLATTTACRKHRSNQAQRHKIVNLRQQNEQSPMEREAMEKARMNILKSRRNQIRFTLRSAESVRNFRLANGFVPQLDEDGKPDASSSNNRLALTLTAFLVAGGAVILRVGGRAALVSTLGLDFVTENPGLKESLDTILNYAENMNPFVEAFLFVAAWTAVKCLCFDAGGVALALASGILFGGVLQGAVFSALAATIGSCVAFSLAKWDTPIRQKALETLEQYPSLRGIEKVVARDGIKAVLTLRLAPVLPIPLGMYNYIYGVTNVSIWDFAGGIFLGSLKPYLLDSYLGYFGKSIVEGSESNGMEDIILLVALGASVVIGVFASQLAGETWDSVAEEIKAEEAAKANTTIDEQNDGIFRDVFGMSLPLWMVGFQLALQQASVRINDIIYTEYHAQVWNHTKEEEIPRDRDPAYALDSPEIMGADKGLDMASSLCESLVLSPLMFRAFWRYSDPFFDEIKEEENRLQARKYVRIQQAAMINPSGYSDNSIPEPVTREELLGRLSELRSRTRQRLQLLDERIEEEKI